MAKISLDMSNADKPSVEVTSQVVAKEWIYKYDRNKSQDTKMLRHIRVEGSYYSVEASMKDGRPRMKLFVSGNKSRIALITEDAQEGDFHLIAPGFDMIKAYFKK